MSPGDWALLALSEIVAVVGASVLAHVLARRCMRRMSESPTTRAATLFAFQRRIGLTALIAVAPATVAWAGRHLHDGPTVEEAWLFAVGWTALVGGSICAGWAVAAVRRAAGLHAPSRAGVLVGAVAMAWPMLLTPLLAGWAYAAALTFTATAGAEDLVGAACYVLGHFAAGAAADALFSRIGRTGAPLPPDLETAMAEAASDGRRVRTVVYPLVAAGIPYACAVRVRGREWIAVDPLLLEAHPRDEAAAILMHELGHHRLDHVRRRERAIHVGLLCVVVVLALIGRGRPLLFLGGVVLLQRFVDLRRWRKQEHEADRFAAQRCGAGTMAAALTRMHRLEGLPEDFGESGAELTHPDLVRRLEALGVAAAPAATH